MDVPEMVLVEVSLVTQAAAMKDPGAKISVQVPQWEKGERQSPCCMELTEYAFTARAGESFLAFLFSGIVWTTIQLWKRPCGL